MSDVFISYARSTEAQAQRIADALRAHGHEVWRDDQLAAHQGYRRIIEERLTAAKVVLVLWSAEAARSDWVCSEASRGRAMGKLVQLTLDGAPVPMPFDEIQCADLRGWTDGRDSKGWAQVLAGIAGLLGSLRARRPGSAEPGAWRRPSIAIMPFANLSGDAGQDYFVDGMVEEITTALSRVRAIFVMASGSSLSFKGQAVSAQEAAQKLGVAYLLEGSVRRAGGRVRIAVRLIDGADGAQLWADQFDDSLEDVFSLQDRVALSVASRIEPTVQVAEMRKTSGRSTENMGSYDLYLRAWPLHRAYTQAATLQAIDLLDRAIDLDPSYGAALALAAVCHNIGVFHGWFEDHEANRLKGVALAHRALAVASDDADVLANAGSVVAGLERDAAAIALFDKAIAMNPASPTAWMMSGIARVRTGDNDLAVLHLETAMRLDPLGPEYPNVVGLLAGARFQQRRFEEAVTLCKSFVRQKEHPRGYAFLAASLGQLGRIAEGQEALDRYRALAPRPIEAYFRWFIVNRDGCDLFLEGIARLDPRP